MCASSSEIITLYGADVNHKNRFGYSSLMWSSSSEIVKLYGADVDSKNNYGQNSLCVYL